jgi:hypothetical protein
MTEESSGMTVFVGLYLSYPQWRYASPGLRALIDCLQDVLAVGARA